MKFLGKGVDPRSVPKRLRLPTMDSDLDVYELYLTPKELAERWRIHAGTLRNWRVQRTGPAYTKLSAKAIIYPLAGVLAYERQHNITVHKKTRPLVSDDAGR